MSFFTELKRRNVYKVAVAYVVVGWLLIQVATQVFPFFEIPNWAVRLVVVALLLGFPVALVLSWAFEITPEGIKRADDILPNESSTRKTGRKLVALTIVITALAAGMFVFRWLQPKGTEGPLTRSVTTASTIPNKSIAVLPFANLSEDKENAYFVEGIQDEILPRLAKTGDLKVISRTSTKRYPSRPDNLKQIAAELGVATILEGRVQKAGNQVLINVQLIDARHRQPYLGAIVHAHAGQHFRVEGEVAQRRSAESGFSSSVSSA